MKTNLKRYAAALLAAVLLCTGISSALAVEVPQTETKTGFPLLADVCEQLDGEEIVSAPDVTVGLGEAFDLLDTSDWEIKNADAIVIELHDAAADDLTPFSTGVPGTYTAWYVVTPVSGHPAYEISRKILVEQLQTALPSEEGGAPASSDSCAGTEDEELEDDPSASIEVSAGPTMEPEMAPTAAPENPMDAAETPAPAEETDASNAGNVSEEVPVEENPGELPDEPVEEPGNDGANSEDGTEPGLDENPQPTVQDDEIDDAPTPVEEDEALAAEGGLPDSANEGAAVSGETTDAPAEDSTSAGDAPATTPTPTEEMPGESPGEGNVLLQASNSLAAEEEDVWDEIPADNIELTGDAKMVRGAKIYYPSALGSWSTFKYTVNGRIAYCLESQKSSPKAGSFAQYILENNPDLEKALYYGYGGPGDISAVFYPDCSDNERYVLTHIAASYFYTGSYSEATYKCSSSGLEKYRVREWINYLAGQEAPPTAAIALSAHNLKVTAVENGVQRTEATTLKADHRNKITLQLPENVTYHNMDTGTSQTGGQVEIAGGTTFYFTAPASLSGTWETGRMDGSIAMLWKAIIVATGTKTQHLGSYATETYGGSVAFSVTWLNQFTLNIVKADAAHTDVRLPGAVIGIYADAGCTQEIATVTTDENGSASCTLDRGYDRLYVREIKAPEGYRLNKTVFTVDIPNGDSVSILIKNDEQSAGLKITKKGEVLAGADVTDSGVVFHYETRRLAGAAYRVYADSAIYAPDGSLLYQKGDIVADALTTNENGETTLNDVPLGSYIVEEISAPAGYALDSVKRKLVLSYAGQEEEIAFDETTFVNERQKIHLTAQKQDATTGQALPGASFSLYADGDIFDYKGERLVSAGTLIETVTTDAAGAAQFTADLPIGYKYMVREVKAPDGYIASEDAYQFSFSPVAQTEALASFSHTFVNQPMTAAVRLIKQDAETEAPQGDAQLSGAVYGLYAREGVKSPDGSGKVLYEKDALVTTMTTDKNGEAFVEGLPLGSYFVKEITPSTGYTLDSASYAVDCQAGDAIDGVVEVSVAVKETVMKQPFEIIKAANNGKTDADLIEGAGFTAWLVSSLSVNADGSYDYTSAEPVAIGADGETEIFTDARGHAVTAPLPYGTYIVRETTTPKNYAPVDDFIVTISENLPDTPQVWRVLLDEEFSARLKIVKTDAGTGRVIPIAGAEFSIYDIDRGQYVTQATTYPHTTQHKTFVTDETGTFTLPEALQPGRYRIEEISAPYGYLLNSTPVEVTVSDDSIYRVDAISGDPVIEVVVQDTAAKGRINVCKEGEVLAGYENGQFVYEMKRLPGVVFDVVAAEDIPTADRQKDDEGNAYLEYAAGSLVATLTTDENGEAYTDDLPLGVYNIIERQTINGFVLDDSVHTVNLVYANQETEVVVEEIAIANERQKVSLTVAKKAEGKETLLAGAQFGLYAAEDIMANGNVIVSAGTCLASGATGETGSLTFDIDLPLGRYLINELAAPAGYVKSDAVIEVDASWQGQDVPLITLMETVENTPTKLLISKADATTGVELSGARLTLTDEAGKTIDQWTSVAGEPHLIEGLEPGKTYILREEIAPHGYLMAQAVEFTINDTGDVQKVVMKDDVPTGTILINKTGEFLSNVSAVESALGWAGNAFSYITGGLKNVTFDVYAYDDIYHADGASPDYYKAGEHVGTITTDSTGIARLEGLPLGKYMVKEAATASGYVLDDQERVIDLSYRDSGTAVVTYSEDWQNERQKARVRVVKLDENTEEPLPGASFGLYAEEDICSASGTVIIAAGTLIQQLATDSNGELVFEADLPVGFSYSIKELIPPAGYASDPDARSFTFEASSTNSTVTDFEYVFVDKPTIVEVTKSSLTTGEELEGAQLQVTDENSNVVDSWVSEMEPHVITGLVVGKTYTLTETLPAPGYVTAESIRFTIADTGDIQPVEMKDDVTKVYVSKTDLTGKEELEGATLVILDSDGNIMERWTSTSEPHYIEMLPIGTYILREESAPSGYTVAEDVTFEVTDTAEIQRVQMKDAPEGTPDNPGTPKTGDGRKPILWGMTGVAALLGLITVIMINRNNRRKF